MIASIFRFRPRKIVASSRFQSSDRCRGLSATALQSPATIIVDKVKHMTKTMLKSAALTVSFMVGCWSNCVLAQNKSNSPDYRIAPSVRVAQRPGKNIVSVEIGEADPYRPRDPRNEPKTVAAHGFCLVTLRDHGRWVLGAKNVPAIREAMIYLFATPRERDIFIASPERYLPVLGGDCVVTFAETEVRVPGRLEWGLIHRQRIYFFASEQMREQFKADPDFYTDVDLVDGGRCPVSRVKDNRDIAGLPETVTVVDGRRYFFANALCRKLFLLNPQRYGLEANASLQHTVSIGTNDAYEAGDSNEPTFGKTRASNNTDDAPVGFNKKLLGSAKKSSRKNAEEATEKTENRAMSGYCPVTIRTRGLWQRGKSGFKKTYDGKVYFMAGPEELAAFNANPKEYAPVLSGDSIVTYATEFARVPGSVFHAAQYKDRLYLFANANETKSFTSNKAQYENADLAYQGNCMVSKVEKKREVPGLPEFEATYLGKRYLFVSEDYLKKFLADSKAYAEE
jgi:YHS domain-containing protein